MNAFPSTVRAAESLTPFSDITQLLVELRRSDDIAQRLSGCLDPEALARLVTEGLVEKFSCVFARIWLVESDRTALRLVASSGLYTRIDGTFARVPMGAYKVGKIAQFGTPFLSNQLADESWVKDRQWALEQGICGFAGYPLASRGEIVGVLVVFSRKPLAPEFLEVLQGLCTTVALSLENALRYQQEKEAWTQQLIRASPAYSPILSEQLATIVRPTSLILVGTERPSPLSIVHLFLGIAESLNERNCNYYRLSYDNNYLSLEVMILLPSDLHSDPHAGLELLLREHSFTASCLGGSVQINAGSEQKVVQVVLSVPLIGSSEQPCVRIRCRYPIVQMAVTHLAYQAGLRVCQQEDPAVPLLTDERHDLQSVQSVIWIKTEDEPPPKGIKACIALSLTATQLRAVIDAVIRGEYGGISPTKDVHELSDREQEIMLLLAKGLRDRQIASQLHISERTVKFHLNNGMTKLNAQTRYQALYEAMKKGLMARKV